MNSSKPAHPTGKPGFTILEILLVTAIMTTLMFAFVPALPSLLAPRGMNRAVSEIQGLLELARNHAMTSSRNVYVCFRNHRDASGTDELQAFVITSDVNRPSIWGEKKTLRDVRPLTSLSRWPDVRLVSFSTLDEPLRTRRFPGAPPKSLADQTPLVCSVDPFLSEPSALAAFLFTPQGRAILVSSLESQHTTSTYLSALDINTPYEKAIDIALRPSRAGVLDTRNPDQAALVLNGASGYIQIIRR